MSLPIRLSIVVPTYNERDNLAPLARRIFAAVDPATSELLIVDDDSPDGTAALAGELGEALRAELSPPAAGHAPLRCIVRKAQRGLATAVIAGLREARGERIVVMDADLSHPPERIPDLVAALDDPDVEMAIGSRFVAGGAVDLDWPLRRRLNSLMGRLLARPLTPVRDMMAGFFCVRRAGLRLSELRPIGYKIALELIVRHGWRRVVEIPIAFADRAAGKTKLNLGEQMRYLRHLGRLYALALSRALTGRR
ncbi:Undecaprenyl-phosphate mannosyltransferase [Phycisphaerae bacterium RAS1]|nr:Undecaprenyl-phosphate mannosyltransferase [Phycisphaerae bacterium RAS1]